MKVKIWKIEKCPFQIVSKGFLELEKFDESLCWRLCNWSCWTEEKPTNLHGDIDVANDDVFFHDPVSDTYHLALVQGWKVFDSYDSVEHWFFDSYDSVEHWIIEKVIQQQNQDGSKRILRMKD